MTEKVQADDVQRRQPRVARCCLYGYPFTSYDYIGLGCVLADFTTVQPAVIQCYSSARAFKRRNYAVRVRTRKDVRAERALFPGSTGRKAVAARRDTSLFTCFEQWLCCPDVSLSAPRSELRSERDSVPHPAQGRCPGFFRALSRKKSTLPRANAALGTGVYCPPLRRTTGKPRTLKLFPAGHQQNNKSQGSKTLAFFILSKRYT